MEYIVKNNQDQVIKHLKDIKKIQNDIKKLLETQNEYLRYIAEMTPENYSLGFKKWKELNNN